MITSAPGRRRGRPPGSKSGKRTEETVPNVPVRVPVRIVEAFKDRHGKSWPARLRWLMATDAGLDPDSGAIRPQPHGGGLRQDF